MSWSHSTVCSAHTHTTLQTAASSSIIFSTRSKKVFSAGYPPFSLLNLFIWQLIVQVQTNPSNEIVLIFQLFVKHSIVALKNEQLHTTENVKFLIIFAYLVRVSKFVRN